METQDPGWQPDYATLQRDPHRGAFYRDSAGNAPLLDPVTGYYVVVDPIQCLELLALPHVQSVEAELAPLQQRFGLDLSHVERLSRHMPIFQSGELHAASRRSISEHLAARRHELRAWIEVGVPRLLEGFFRPGRIEFMQDVAVPLVMEFIGTVNNAPLPTDVSYDWVSFVFDGLLSFKKRKMVYDQLRDLRAAFARIYDCPEDDDRLILPMIMMIFGREPLSGSIGESLRLLILQNPGKALRDIEFPATPPASGVPYVERVAGEAFELRGVAIPRGARIKMFLQCFGEYEGGTQNHRFFGAGAHVCPGRPLSTEIWRRIGAVLRTSPMTATVIDYQIRDNNYLLTSPSRLLLELSN